MRSSAYEERFTRACACDGDGARCDAALCERVEREQTADETSWRGIQQRDDA